MSLPIYQAEIDAGISEKIKSNASVAYLTEIKPCHLEDDVKNEIEADIAKAEDKQVDLYYLDSVLASVGWNNNDDIFDPHETWIARNTAVDKKFNFMHDEEQIIGHITSSFAFDDSGGLIRDDIPFDAIPDKFDIVVSSVLYKYWEDEDKQTWINQIIDEISKGRWFVSMECLFKNFDYGFSSPDGEQKIVARNKETAFLSKYLRVYGGVGEFQGNKIGRVLRNFVFHGKGLVEQPANKRSIIFNSAKAFKSTKTSKVIMESDMSESEVKFYKDKVEALEKSLAGLTKERNDLKTELASADRKSFEQKVEDLEAEVARLEAESTSANESVEEKDQKISELEQSVAEKDESLTNIQKELDEMKSSVARSNRVSTLVDVGLGKEDAESVVDKFSKADDEMFKEVVEMQKARLEVETNKNDNDEENLEEEESSKAEDVDLENAEAEDIDLNSGEEEIDDILSTAAEWFGENVFGKREKVKENK